MIAYQTYLMKEYKSFKDDRHKAIHYKPPVIENSTENSNNVISSAISNPSKMCMSILWLFLHYYPPDQLQQCDYFNTPALPSPALIDQFNLIESLQMPLSINSIV